MSEAVPTKPGYQTTEFWTTLASQVVALLVALHAVTVQDAKTLDNAVAAAIVAVFTLAANAVVVWKYIAGRVHLKTTARAILILAAACFLTPHTQAQYLLPFRNNHEQRLRALESAQRQPGADSGTSQALAQLAANQQKLLELLQGQKQSAPGPQLTPPAQQIPLGQPPAQQIPLGGPPLQQIPLGAPPAQQIPLGQTPQQQIPLGGPPRQQLDPAQPPSMQPPAKTHYALYR